MKKLEEDDPIVMVGASFEEIATEAIPKVATALIYWSPAVKLDGTDIEVAHGKAHLVERKDYDPIIRDYANRSTKNASNQGTSCDQRYDRQRQGNDPTLVRASPISPKVIAIDCNFANLLKFDLDHDADGRFASSSGPANTEEGPVQSSEIKYRQSP